MDIKSSESISEEKENDAGNTSSVTSELYLYRGPEFFNKESLVTCSLFEFYKLREPFKKICKKSLPDMYTHFIQDIIMPRDGSTCRGGLRNLLEGQPFDRPIQPFSEETLRSAFSLQPISKTASVRLKEDNRQKLIPSPPPDDIRGQKRDFASIGSNRQVIDVPTGKPSTSESGAKDDREKRDKRERKRKKREKEDLEDRVAIIQKFIEELTNITWDGWILKGKPSNPFLQKITRQNCRRLGVPNYFDFVAIPMDLTTMKEKVERHEYTTLEQVAADIDLLVANATKFNRVGEPVHKMAIDLSSRAVKRVSELKRELEANIQERRRKRLEKKKKDKKKKKTNH